MEKILIIGNGFDLAHGLPTSYTDFLEFGKRFILLYSDSETVEKFEKEELSPWKGNQIIKDQLKSLFQNRECCKKSLNGCKYTLNDSDLDKLYSLLTKNIWFNYFFDRLKANKLKGVNWIDFESEISDVIQWIDKNNTGMDESYDEFKQKMEKADSRIITFYHYSKLQSIGKLNKTVEGFIDILYQHLEDFISALNIYMYRFVEPLFSKAKKLDVISDIKPDKVMSFNYTHTFSKIYDDDNNDNRTKAEVCYIHGECGPESENLVLGIDEYQDPGDRDEHNDMAIFKKFVQRIRKRNSVDYRKWYDGRCHKADLVTRKTDKPSAYYDVYVYGHSLDITDKDILELFLKPYWASVHVFAYNKLDEGRKYPNLIRIMGEDTVIEKAISYPPRLETIIG